MPATLANIRTKVRRLTASPSPNNLTDATIDDYVNTFYLYDMPNHLKLLNLKTVYTFYTTPNVDVYAMPVNPEGATLPAYSSVEPPVYVSGYESFYTQGREEFFRIYSPINADEDLANGNGTAGPYAFTITNVPVLRNQITISAVDAGGITRLATDDGAGNLIGDIAVAPPATPSTIDYVTGAVTVEFNANIPNTSAINVQSVPYQASRPTAMLFYDNEFILRPVPDKAYRVDINAYVLPTTLGNNPAGTPELNELWQLLAAGASKKILEDRMDMQGVSEVMPLYTEQMRLCMRRTIQQQRPVRTATIYTEQAEFAYGNLYGNRF